MREVMHKNSLRNVNKFEMLIIRIRQNNVGRDHDPCNILHQIWLLSIEFEKS